MASVRTRKGPRGTTHATLYRDPDTGRQTSRTFPTVEGAEEFAELINRMGAAAALRILEATEATTLTGAPKPTTLGEHLTDYIDRLTGIEEGTRTGYHSIAATITAHPIGRLPITAITRADVEAWIRDQEKTGLSYKTIVNRRGLLSAALARAVEDQHLPKNPAYRLRIARTERQEMVFLTPTEYQILRARATEHYRPFLDILVLTGLRFGEATALQRRDLHLNDEPPTLTVARSWKKSGQLGPPKTKKARRTISLPDEAAEILREASRGKQPDDLVLVNKAGRRILQDTIWKLWDRWVDDTGREEPHLHKSPRIHDLRHSHASWMLAAGISLHDLRHRLGHESIQTTSDTYGHLMPEAQIQAARAASLMYRQGLTIEAEPAAVQQIEA